MISKLKDIFLSKDGAVFSTDNSPLHNRSKGEDSFETNKSYFIDNSTGLGFRFAPDAFTFSKSHRRIQFALLFLFAVFYPLIAFRSLYLNTDYSRRDVLKIFLFYVPLSLGALFISFFGIFCPLRAITLMHNLDNVLLGKNYLFCMAPLDFKDNDSFFSDKSAKIATLRQHIISRLILLVALCAIEFMFLHYHMLYKLALGFAAHNIIIIAAIFIFSVAMLSLFLSIVGAIQSYGLLDYEVAKCHYAISEYIVIYSMLLSLVFLSVILISPIILSPILFASVVSLLGLGASVLFYYWYFKEQLYSLFKFLFFGQYVQVAVRKFDARAVLSSYYHKDKVLQENRKVNLGSDVRAVLFANSDIFDIINSIEFEAISNNMPDDVEEVVRDRITPSDAIKAIKKLSSEEVRFKKEGRTALMEVVKLPDEHGVKIAGILLAKGININARDSSGYTVLMQACIGNKQKLLSFLLEKGAYINDSDINTIKKISDKNIFKETLYEILEAEYENRSASFAKLEQEATSWWSYFLFSLTGRGKFVELISRYKYEIQGRDDEGFFENINITPYMARLIAKIRKCDVEEKKYILKQKLKHQYVKVHNITSVEKIHNNYYELLLSHYEDYKKLLNDYKNILSYCEESEKPKQLEDLTCKIKSVENHINELYKLLGIERSLSFIDNLKNRVDSDVKEIHKSRSKSSTTFYMAKLEHKFLSSYFSFGSAKLCQVYADYYNLPKQLFTVTFMRALAKMHIKNRSENEIYDSIVDRLIKYDINNNIFYNDLSGAKHYSMLPDHSHDNEILDLALTHYRNRIDKRELFRKARGYAFETRVTSIFYWLNFTNIEEHINMLDLLARGKFDEDFNKVEREVLEEVIKSDLDIYYNAVAKAQNRFKFGELLLSTARDDESVVYRLFARSRYYLGFYFIKVNLLYLPYGFLLALKNDIKKNIQCFYSSYRAYVNFRDHDDADQDILSSFIRDTALDVAEFFIDLVCIPFFACYSAFLSLYRSYRQWVAFLKVPASNFRIISWFLTLIVKLLQLVLDAAYFPIFVILYPVWCIYDYFCIAYKDLSDAYDNVCSIKLPHGSVPAADLNNHTTDTSTIISNDALGDELNDEDDEVYDSASYFRAAFKDSASNNINYPNSTSSAMFVDSFFGDDADSLQFV